MCRRWLTAVLATMVVACGLGRGETYHASPTGDGDGRSPAGAFTVADFWKVARPGDTLVLVDGRYTGAASMLTPPQKLSGEPGRPITIRALNDGKVEIDGEHARCPVKLHYNDWFVLEGFNAHSAHAERGRGTVVDLSNSNCCIVRRVCAWDAEDNNTEIFGTHSHGDHNLFEDCAGWGIARKTYSNSQGGDYTTYRRCLAIWQGSHAVGPKMAFSMFYNSRGIVAQNCIAFWDGVRMKETHQAMGYDGKPFTNWSSGDKKPRTYTNFGVDQPQGCFSNDANRGIGPSPAPYLYGCLSYALKTHRLVRIWGLFALYGQQDTRVENCAALVEDGVADLRPFYLTKFRGSGLTAVGGQRPAFAGAAIENTLHVTGVEGRAAWAAVFRNTNRSNNVMLRLSGITVAMFALSVGESPEAQGAVRAGAAVASITADKSKARVHDPLLAKVLVLEEGGSKVVIICMDTLIAADSIVGDIRHGVERELDIAVGERSSWTGFWRTGSIACREDDRPQDASWTTWWVAVVADWPKATASCAFMLAAFIPPGTVGSTRVARCRLAPVAAYVCDSPSPQLRGGVGVNQSAQLANIEQVARLTPRDVETLLEFDRRRVENPGVGQEELVRIAREAEALLVAAEDGFAECQFPVGHGLRDPLAVAPRFSREEVLQEPSQLGHHLHEGNEVCLAVVLRLLAQFG